MIPFLNLEPILQAPAGHPVSEAEAIQPIWRAVNSNFRCFQGIPALSCQVVFLAFCYPSICHLVPPGPGINPLRGLGMLNSLGRDIVPSLKARYVTRYVNLDISTR